jgi:putative transposase
MKTYKFKLYNDDDFKYLHEVIVTAGEIYNFCIKCYKGYYKHTGKYLNKFELMKHITRIKKVNKYWSIVNSQSIQNIVERIDEGYKLFFKYCKKKKISPPSYCKISKYKSVTYKQNGFKFIDNTNVVILQGRKYRYHKSRDIKGDIKTLTLKRNPLGEFYICVTTDATSGKIGSCRRTQVGIDFGLKDFLTLSNGTKIQSPLFLTVLMPILRKKSRKHSLKKIGSNNRYKNRLNLARFHEKISDKRKDFFYKLSHELCSKYDFISFEDLNLAGMKRLWGRKISDLAFASFLTILKSTAAKYDTEIVFIDRYFPSSKLCSECGLINKNLSLKDRTWQCSCGANHDRDINASINILRQGIASSTRIIQTELSSA